MVSMKEVFPTTGTLRCGSVRTSTRRIPVGHTSVRSKVTVPLPLPVLTANRTYVPADICCRWRWLFRSASEREGSADLGRCSSDACYGDQTKRLASLSSLSHYQLTIRCRERHIGSRGSKHVLIDNLVGLAQQELEEAEEAYELSGYAPNEVRDQKQ